MIVDDYESIAQNHALLFAPPVEENSLLQKLLNRVKAARSLIILAEEEVLEKQRLWALKNESFADNPGIMGLGPTGPLGSPGPVGARGPEGSMGLSD